MPEHDLIAQWEERWHKLLDVSERPAEHADILPAWSDHQRAAEAACRVLKRMRVFPNDPEPLRSAAKRLGDRLCGNYARDGVTDAAVTSLLDLERKLAAALDAGADVPDLINPKHFQTFLSVPSGWFMPDNMTPVVLAAGVVDSLPPDHRLRSVVPADDLYLANGTEPCLLLGPMFGSRQRLIYFADAAANLTRDFRAAQRRKEQEKAEEDRLERLAEARRIHSGEIGQLRQKLKAALELDRAVQEGRLPELPTAPAVLSPAGR